mgnify:CR=1 FL=1
MRASWLGPDRIVQHLLGEIALGAVGAGIGIAALHVSVLAAVDVVVRARRGIGAAKCVVVGAGGYVSGPVVLMAALMLLVLVACRFRWRSIIVALVAVVLLGLVIWDFADARKPAPDMVPPDQRATSILIEKG